MQAEGFVLQRLVHASLVRERLMAMLSGFFGVLAALLASIGLYGVIAYVMQRRRNEVGIRLALGARPGQVVRMVLIEAALLVAGGVAAGAVSPCWRDAAASRCCSACRRPTSPPSRSPRRCWRR